MKYVLFITAILALSSCGMTERIVTRQKQMMNQHMRDLRALRVYRGDEYHAYLKLKNIQQARLIRDAQRKEAKRSTRAYLKYGF